MRHSAYKPGHDGGFTLIELMITVAVVAILAVIAVPSYQESMRKGRRADAIAGLNQLQQAQERFRGNAPAYASTVAALPGAPAESPEHHYALTVDSAAATTYQMTATAKSTSPQYADTRCRSLRVTMNAGTIGHTSLDASAAEDTTNSNRCWPQ